MYIIKQMQHFSALKHMVLSSSLHGERGGLSGRMGQRDCMR